MSNDLYGMFSQMSSDTQKLPLKIEKKQMLLASVAALFCTTAFYPPSLIATLPIGLLSIWYMNSNEKSYPLDEPIYLEKNKKSKNFIYKENDGVVYLGKSIDKEEVWIGIDRLREHILLFGSKTSPTANILLNIASNYIISGSGLVFIEAEGDIGVQKYICSVAQRFGRANDVLLLNMNDKKEEEITTHTFNPFIYCSEKFIAEMIRSAVEDPSDIIDVMWNSRSEDMIIGISKCLVWLRDNRNEDINLEFIRDCFKYENIISMINNEDIPMSNRINLKSYLECLPGYRGDNVKPLNVLLEQHGILEEKYMDAFDLLIEKCGHIFKTENPDIDLRNVVAEKKILVVTADDMGQYHSVCRMVLLAIDDIIDSILEGKELDGDMKISENIKLFHGAENGKKSNIGRKRVFPVIMNNCAKYIQNNINIKTAKARATMFSYLFAESSICEFKKNNKQEKQIIENTGTKIFFAEEDTNDEYLTEKDGERKIGKFTLWSKEKIIRGEASYPGESQLNELRRKNED